jgi:hypothetical protein
LQIARGEHETAQKTIAVCLEAFNLLPGFVEQFEETAMALQPLLLEDRIKPLETLIQDFSLQPTLLAVAIGQRGFGQESSEQAHTLWEAFCATVTATYATERPWPSIRDFAFNLQARPEFAGTAIRMISDLFRFGQTRPQWFSTSFART